MKKLLSTIFLFSQFICFSQNNITENLIINQLERLSENSEETIDYTELIDAYWSIYENKVNVNNSDELSQLIEFHFISTYLIESIKEYRRNFGDIRFFDELKFVDGMDTLTLAILEPIVCFNNKNDSNKYKFKNVFKYAKHQVIFEIDRNLNKKAGYQYVADSILYENPNKKYLGDPNRLFLRYNFSCRDKIEAGFVLEKDPGEYLFTPKINDSIKKMLKSHLYSTFDFWSFHFIIRDIKLAEQFKLNAIVIGDYQVGFGQGLTMGSGVAFTNSGGSLLRKAKNIRASKSANESNYLRGVAASMRVWKFDITGFYSNTNTDANVSVVDSLDKPEKISSIQQTGLHRTFNELIDRHSITKKTFGGNVSYRTSNFQIGYSIHKTILSCDLYPDPKVFNTFYFNGKSLVNQGIDFYYILKKFSFYGEAAMSDNKAPAFLIGTTVQPTGYVDFTILYRYYDKKYQNFYSNSYAAGSGNRNEKGLYISTSFSFAPKWKFIATADFPQSDWIKMTAYSPSRCQNYDLQISHQINNKALFFIELRHKNKEKNGSGEAIYMRKLIHERKTMLRFHITYPIGESLILKNRAEYHINKTDYQSNTNSFLIYQDVMYSPVERPISFVFRYALFDSPDGSVYAYENDVLYSFSISSMNHQGMRLYLLAKLKFAKIVSLNAKIGCTIYNDINDIGSDLEKIDGNVKADVKLQMIIKL